MRFKQVKLYTNKLSSELNFYSQVIGCEVLRQDATSFTVKVGWSELTFVESDKNHDYHYCFLIPSDRLQQALSWMSERVEIIQEVHGQKIHHFDFWNAESFYFYDGSGNVAECIVRYDLDHQSSGDFDVKSILGVNEVGMPTADIAANNTQLESQLKTRFYKGNETRFGTHGTLEGIFLMPNYQVKTTWYPTDMVLKPEPFEVIVEVGDSEYKVEYRDEKLVVSANC